MISLQTLVARLHTDRCLRFAVAPLCLATILTAGCHANDPRVNPKARWAQINYVAGVALQPYQPMDAYDRQTIKRQNPETGHMEDVHVFTLREQKDLPGSFAVAFDTVEGRSYLRADAESCKNLTSLSD